MSSSLDLAIHQCDENLEELRENHWIKKIFKHVGHVERNEVLVISKAPDGHSLHTIRLFGYGMRSVYLIGRLETYDSN